MIFFIDTNIFMYAIGTSHPFKEKAQALIRLIGEGTIKGAINTEVLQEVLYRYSSIGKSKIGYQLFEMLTETFHHVWPVFKEDLIEARTMQEKYSVKTRDAIHAATMFRNGVNRLYSFDTDFDRIPRLKRLIP